MQLDRQAAREQEELADSEASSSKAGALSFSRVSGLQRYYHTAVAMAVNTNTRYARRLSSSMASALALPISTLCLGGLPHLILTSGALE